MCRPSGQRRGSSAGSGAAAWETLLAGCAGVFTVPSFRIFADLVTGWALCPGRRTITRIITIVDPEGSRAHDAYHRFVRAGAWSMTALWRVLTLTAVAALCPTGVVCLDLDDTLFHKTGRRIVGAGSFRDAIRSTRRRVVYAHGLNLVVLTLRITPPWGGEPLGLPVNMRVYRKGGPTHIELAEQMIVQVAGWLPGRDLHLGCDGAYATLAGKHLPRTHVTSGMRRDAAIYEPPPPRTGRRGRPRKKGDRLPTPAQIAAQTTDGWTRATVDVRGRPVEKLVLSRQVLWYSVCPDRLVQLVIVRDPDGHERDDFLFTTDLDAAPEQVAGFYAGRWSIQAHVPQQQAVPRRTGPPNLDPPRTRTCRRAVTVAERRRVAVVHPRPRDPTDLAGPALVPGQTRPVVHRRARRAEAHPVAATNYTNVVLSTAPGENHRHAH